VETRQTAAGGAVLVPGVEKRGFAGRRALYSKVLVEALLLSF